MATYDDLNKVYNLNDTDKYANISIALQFTQKKKRLTKEMLEDA